MTTRDYLWACAVVGLLLTHWFRYAHLTTAKDHAEFWADHHKHVAWDQAKELRRLKGLDR